MSVRAVLCLLLYLLLLGASLNAGSNQFEARYVPIGASGAADLLAVDGSGNFFVVATVQEPSGLPQIRAIKTDGQGNVLASFDFGGSSGDMPSGIAIDAQGNPVIVGTTYSADFPLVSPLVSSSDQTGFVVQLDSQLTKILFSTRLGSAANAVAIDSPGNIYVTGSTSTSDFPVTPGAFQTKGPPQATGFGAAVYGFVTEISPAGTSIVYSTFFGSPAANCYGGSICVGVYGYTSASAIAVDSAGAAVIGGTTLANQLPVTPGALGQTCGCQKTQPSLIEAGFLAKFATGGQTLDWATYLPPAPAYQNPDNTPDGYIEYIPSITSIALDADENVVFSGNAPEGLFVTSGALQSSYPPELAGFDYGAPFVAKVNAAATSYIFSTYFGEGTYQYQSPQGALVLDSQGDIWLTGGSAPSVLPLPSSVPLIGDVYVAELSPDGSSVLAGITAPAGAAGRAIVLTPAGTPAALGSTGSLLVELANQPAALLGVENSAGIQASGNIAPYELVSLYGTGIGPAQAIGGQVANGYLTNSLGGVQVLFNNVAAPLLYAGPNQINAIVPESVAEGDTAALQIVTPNGTLAGPALTVVPSEPEVFQSSAPAPAGGEAVALNQDGSLNSASNPASAGSIVTVWATGAGQDDSPGDQDGRIVTTADLFTPSLPVAVLDASNVNIQGVYSLEVLYAGNAVGLVTGAIQVNFRVPENLTNIGQLTCQLQIGAAVSSRFSIYVQQ